MNERCSGTCGKLPGEGVAVGLLVRDNFKLKIGRSMHWSCREVNYITVVQSIYSHSTITVLPTTQASILRDFKRL